MSERRLWTHQVKQDNIIKSLVERHGGKKWTQIAIDMRNEYPNLNRSSKQIRERWYNHLDPQINQKPWSQQEQVIILQAHRRIGSKWKEIAKLLEGRTDSSVKNHFYSTLRRSLRRMNKFLGFKNSTNQMRVLKPSILCRLIEEGQKSCASKVLIDGIFQFANIKPKNIRTLESDSKHEKLQKEHVNWDIEQRKLYKNEIEKLQQFNCAYEKGHVMKNKHSIKNNKTRLKIDCLVTDVSFMLQTKQNLEIIVKQEETSKGIETFSNCDFSCQNDWPQEREIGIEVGLNNDDSEIEENIVSTFPLLYQDYEKTEVNENIGGMEYKVQQFLI